MPQFAPIFTLLLFVYVWMIFLYLFSVLWWISKSGYSLK
uniref:ATP synthase F0 subunit 8 n=1 Tax=Callista chinensis TaxID=990943 RepID=A0A889QIB9_9BIVA|nr:ATP synthase F0 subunit 8 [Callista chinensis]QRE83923.1 ATP synthase F0 subunit 8 [Callista chinensis]QWM94242.1 ATP synthase F0 subunit 8 [Callista chinensis]